MPSWKVWGLIADVILEASLQAVVFAHWSDATTQSYALFLFSSSILGGILGIASFLVVLLPTSPYSRLTQPFDRHTERGEYAGTRNNLAYFILTHPELHDESIPLDLFDLSITGAQGRNEYLASITVQTLPGVICSVDVKYEESQHPATAKTLDFAKKADGAGLCTWVWTPLQYRIYVGLTHVTIKARYKRRHRTVLRDFEMQP